MIVVEMPGVEPHPYIHVDCHTMNLNSGSTSFRTECHATIINSVLELL